MTDSASITATSRNTIDPVRRPFAEASTDGASGVSWAAIFAGAAGAAALSLILLVLGAGLGMSSVSPWTGRGASATAVGASTIAWLTFTQLAASGMGGYLAGRLRTKWAGVHTDEVYFRDTAHGFLAWAVATLVTAALLTSAISSVVGGGVQAGASLAGGTAAAATTGAATVAGAAARTDGADAASGPNMGMAYFVDTLFRKNPSAGAAVPTTPADASSTAASGAMAAPAAVSAAPTASVSDASQTDSSSEVARILATSVRTGTLAPEDARYAGQLVAQRTGLPLPEAEKRVADTFAKVQTMLKDAETTAREAADKARKASAYAALWLFVSLLIGAFAASLAATFGGRQRDL